MVSALVRDPVLLVLWLLWVAFLVASLVMAMRRADRRLPMWGKIGSSVVLALAGWVGAISGKPTVAAGILVALGMTAGLAGDLALAPLLPLRQPLLVGLGAFGVGHLFYCAALLAYAGSAGLLSAGPMIVALIVWWAFGVGGWYMTVRRDGEPTPLHGAALVYSLLLATTAGLSSAIAMQRLELLPAAIGAALFLSSDILLAAGLFSDTEIPARDVLIWGTYGPAQMFLVFGIVLAAL